VMPYHPGGRYSG